MGERGEITITALTLIEKYVLRARIVAPEEDADGFPDAPWIGFGFGCHSANELVWKFWRITTRRRLMRRWLI